MNARFKATVTYKQKVLGLFTKKKVFYVHNYIVNGVPGFRSAEAEKNFKPSFWHRIDTYELTIEPDKRYIMLPASSIAEIDFDII